MQTSIILTGIVTAALLAGCGDKPTSAAHGVIQTKYPGQVSSGGATSGQVLARNARPDTDATYAGGTPGIAGGAGGNTSGAETGGTVQESGQGPSSGTTQPSSAGRPGAALQAGDTGGATPPSPQRESAPTSNAGPGGK